MKMADSHSVELDLYADDLENHTSQDDFTNDGVDLYDDVIFADPLDTTSIGNDEIGIGENEDGIPGTANGAYHIPSGSNLAPTHVGRRHQVYIGNLTWWTTDQDIENAVKDVGVTDFQEVKFFENRSNGQSKGFCVVTLGTEASMRVLMDRLSKKELHNQTPVVTYPTKQALNQFESQQKTRPLPPQQNGPRGPLQLGGMQQHQAGHPPPPGHQPRMMNPNMPGQFVPQHLSQNMPGPPGLQGPARMQPPPMHQGGPMGPQQQMQGPPRYPNQGQWNGPRPNGPPRPGLPNGPNGPHQQRPQMFQGMAGHGMPARGPRPEWNRPPMHGGFPTQGQPGPQGPPHLQGPRGPPPPQMGGPGGPPAGMHGPSPHVNPAFFNQSGGPPAIGGGPMGGPIGPPGASPNINMQHGAPHHFNPQTGPRGPWPGAQTKPPGTFPEQPPIVPQLTEVEFEEIMGRNRTVSSSAIARAVSDAAAGEFTSAVETLVTAISLIKQSKVSHDERCKILISSLQDTLHGIETKSYVRRERSRSRDRTHRSRPRRDRSSSRYRERSRDRDRERDRGDGKYSSDRYRERSRSRERERGNTDHYRDDSTSRSTRPRKSPEQPAEPTSETSSSKRNYYDHDRYRSSSDRDRDRNHRDRDRERDRREEHRSRH